MKNSIGVLTAVGLLAISVGAQADPIISDIGIEVRQSSYVVGGSESISDLYNEFLSGSLLCDASLDSLDNAGSSQSCGESNTDIATLFTIDITQDSDTTFQFGADWGRGGAIFIAPASDDNGYLVPGDTWWGYNWSSGDVLSFAAGNGGSTSYTLGLLGFEGCCGGGMSLRYLDANENWQTVAVNVAEPGTLALLGLGLLGVGAARRRKA